MEDRPYRPPVTSGRTARSPVAHAPARTAEVSRNSGSPADPGSLVRSSTATRRALVVGDLIHHGVHAWLEGGIVDGRPRPDLEAWKRTIEWFNKYVRTAAPGTN